MATSFDPFAVRSRYIIDQHHANHELLGEDISPLPELDELLDREKRAKSLSEDLPVCIIGAGAAGLYTALILQSLKIPYTILEASDRVGGRMYTYPFGKSDFSDYQYFEVGAMRFPKTLFMERIFDLVGRLKNPPKWIPYIWESDNTQNYFNARLLSQSPWVDPYNMKASLPEEYKYLSNPTRLQSFTENVMVELKSSFKNVQPGDNLDQLFKDLFQQYDGYSMRTYLAGVKGYPQVVIDLMETFDKGTGWYDRSLVESICESLSFQGTGRDQTDLSWFCFDKGSYQLPKAMKDNLPDDVINFDSKVTRIESAGHQGIYVNWKSVHSPESLGGGHLYSAVISTIPFGPMRAINMSESGINDSWAQSSAIRELQYGPAMKIAVRFKENWWEQMGIVGGQSFTDTPLRTIVYPSYPEHSKKSNVLIVSYCWTQDAERLGSLTGKDEMTREILYDLIIDVLTAAHGGRDELAKYNNPKIMKGYLGNMIEDPEKDIFVYDWLRDPNSMGGFSFFGPQQFESMYPEVTKPAADGRLFFGGEAITTAHFWVAGALEGAWTAVHTFLDCFGTDQQRKQFIEEWGASAYWDGPTLSKHLRLGLHEQNLARKAAEEKAV